MSGNYCGGNLGDGTSFVAMVNRIEAEMTSLKLKDDFGEVLCGMAAMPKFWEELPEYSRGRWNEADAVLRSAIDHQREDPIRFVNAMGHYEKEIGGLIWYVKGKLTKRAVEQVLSENTG